jgi:hypothetical protein
MPSNLTQRMTQLEWEKSTTSIKSTCTFRLVPSLTIEEAQVAVPPNRDHIDQQYSVIEWDELEIHKLDKWPYHPVLLQGHLVGLVQLLLRARPLHDRHAAQEDKHIGGGKDGLISSNSCNDFEVLVFEHNLVLEKFEPGRSCWTEDGWESQCQQQFRMPLSGH